MVPKGVKGRPKMILDAATLGAAGLIMLDPLNRLADERIVLPLDMVCIPAYQAYMINGTPSLQIYVRAGETIIPTGGNVKDVQEAMIDATVNSPMEQLVEAGVAKRRSTTAYQRAYKKAFKQVAPKYKLKNGKWKKDGFKRAVKEAHKIAKGGK
jgi:hypothetical protein